MKGKNLREAIAIDFDGCLCEDKYPDIGLPNWTVINAARRRQENGAGLILWTCREGEALEAAIDAAKSWGLHFDAVNESLPEWKEYYGNNPRKVGATEYWDDKAVGISSDGAPISLSHALPPAPGNNDGAKGVFYVNYAIDARFVARVEAETVNEALNLAESAFVDADFGEAEEIDGEPISVENEDGNFVWEKD